MTSVDSYYACFMFFGMVTVPHQILVSMCRSSVDSGLNRLINLSNCVASHPALVATTSIGNQDPSWE